MYILGFMMRGILPALLNMAATSSAILPSLFVNSTLAEF